MVVTETRKMYWRDNDAENKMKSGAEAAARALNAVVVRFKFNNVSEIPDKPHEWKIKRMLEDNPELAERAKVHKLETLIYTVPDWIEAAANAFTIWHSIKSQYLSYLEHIKQENETWSVNFENLETLFDSNSDYRRYLSPEQAKRLDLCKRYIDITNEAGLKFPDDFCIGVPGMAVLGIVSVYLVRVVEGRFVPCSEFVLSGNPLPKQAPMQRTNDYH